MRYGGRGITAIAVGRWIPQNALAVGLKRVHAYLEVEPSGIGRSLPLVRRSRRVATWAVSFAAIALLCAGLIGVEIFAVLPPVVFVIDRLEQSKANDGFHGVRRYPQQDCFDGQWHDIGYNSPPR